MYSKLLRLALILFIFFSAIYLSASNVSAQVSTDPNFKVAFIGDAGSGNNATDVLNLIKSEGTQAVLHQGDFDYSYNAKGFWDKINSVLPANFPYFVSVGNHDDASWNEGCGDLDGCYAKFQKDRLAAIGVVPDSPDLNDQLYSVTYKGLKMVFVGLKGNSIGTSTYAPYIQSQLQSDNHIWRVCSWHKNQNTMQVGGKKDDMGWAVYETCRQQGAIIATAHEHTYHRTKTLTNIQGLTVDTAQHPLVAGVPSNPNSVLVAPGKTFVFVSGLGGNGPRNQQRCFPFDYPYGGGAGCNYIWASIYTTDTTFQASQTGGSMKGALFITFNVDGNPNKARGYFKDTAGNIVDPAPGTSSVPYFEITNSSTAVTGQPTPTPTQGGATPTPTPTPGGPTPTRTPTPTPGGQFCTFWRGFNGGATPTPTPPTSTSTPTPTGSLNPTSTSTPTPLGPTSTPPPPPPPGAGIWISQDEIASLPLSGPAWSNVKSAAEGSWGTAQLSNQDSRHPQYVLAGALVAVRTGDSAMKTKTINGLKNVIGQKPSRALDLGRNLAAYVAAADVINLRTADSATDQQFRSWISQMRTTSTSGAAANLIDCHEKRPNNWGTMCGASRIAADLYLGDTADLNKAITVYKGFIGDWNAYHNFTFQSGADSWTCNPAKKTPINPPGCVKSGVDLSGALIDDVQRCCSFRPHPVTNYAWGGFAGLVAQAEMLYRAGYDSYGWQDQAVKRGRHFLDSQMADSAGAPTEWMPWVVNKNYGTNYPANTPTGWGRLMGWTDWTHGR